MRSVCFPATTCTIGPGSVSPNKQLAHSLLHLQRGVSSTAVYIEIHAVPAVHILFVPRKFPLNYNGLPYNTPYHQSKEFARSSTGEPNRPGNSILDSAVSGLRTVDVSGTLHWTPAVGSKNSGTEASGTSAQRGSALCAGIQKKRAGRYARPFHDD